MNLFILAAGLGSRLKPLTLKYPKPCVPFLNVPMGYYHYRFLESVKPDTSVVNLFHLPEKVETLYSKNPFSKNKNLFSKDGDFILGSAGGLKKASKLFAHNEAVLMMNSDEIFFTKNFSFLKNAFQQHISNNNLATLVCTQHPEAGKKFGAIWCDSKNRVRNILPAQQTPSQLHIPWHYIGIIFLNKKVLDLIPEKKESNIFYDILIKELNHSSVEIFNLNCDWYETGNPSDYLAATKSVLSTIDKKTLDFISIYDPSRVIQNEGGVSLVSNAIKIEAEKLKGFNVISKTTNTKIIDSLPKIENSVLFESEVLNLRYFS